MPLTLLYIAYLSAIPVFFLICLALRRVSGTYGKAPLPPGPKALPLIGNALDFPLSFCGPRLHELGKPYGDIMYLELFGRPVIVIDKYEVARELIEKRSSNYSDRPHSVMATLVGFSDWAFVLMGYGPKWRAHRRAIHQAFHVDVTHEHEPSIARATTLLLQGLLESPSNFSKHINRAIASSVLRSIYGFELEEDKQEYFHMGEALVEMGAEMATAGRFLVDTFPVLRFLPSWFPGGGFQKTARLWKARTRQYRDALFDLGLTVRATGAGERSLLGRILGESEVDTPDVEAMVELCKGVSATAYAGATDTTNSAIHIFFLVMSLFPEAQRRAQAELDSVIGPDRLPSFSDRPSLPYVNALIKEVIRWLMLAPLGVARRSVADDIYNGYLIPAGTIMIANAWAMSQDEEAYRDPKKFDPERFLLDGQFNTNIRDPYSYIFGFGRRICPGMHFADRTIFMVFASVLHAFTIGPLAGESSHEVPLDSRLISEGITTRPKPFQCRIEPRLPHTAELIRLAT